MRALERARHRITRRRARRRNAATAQRLGYRVIAAQAPIVGEARARGVEHAAWLAALAREHAGRAVRGVRAARRPCASAAAGSADAIRNWRWPRCLGSRRSDRAGGAGQRRHRRHRRTDRCRGRDRRLDAAPRARGRPASTRCSILKRTTPGRFSIALGDLVRTGATNTNVGDVQVALIGAAPMIADGAADRVGRGSATSGG